MRIKRVLVLGILLMSILVGCGGKRDIDVEIHIESKETDVAAGAPTLTPAAPEPTAAPAEPTAAPAEPTAAPVEPTTPPDQGPAPTEAPPSQAPTQPPPTDAPPPPTAAPQEGEGTYTFNPEDWLASITTLSSFRQKATLDFVADNTGAHSKATYEGEVTTNPMALHSILRVEGQAAAQLPANQVEVIWIGDQAWVKIGRKPWISVPVTALETEYAGQVVGVGDLLPYIQQARRVMPDETVNGILCEHYVYDMSNLPVESGMTSAQGDIWVAKAGGYVVRLTMKGQGTYYDVYTVDGALNLVYDLYDVNAPISIKPPR